MADEHRNTQQRSHRVKPAEEASALKVLLISEDAPTRSFLLEALQEHGHEAVLAQDASATWQVARGDIDLVLFDLGQNDQSQWERLGAWRRATDVPLITLGSWGNEVRAVRALRIGADDYLARPLHIAELLARMEARLRRFRLSSLRICEQQQSEPGEHFDLDPTGLQVKYRNRTISLSSEEFMILEVLVRRAGQLVSREDLIKLVWGEEADEADSKLTAHIWQLRRKLEPDPRHPMLILTRWGLGYSLQGSTP